MILDQPIQIGSLTVQNRLVMPPMQTNKTNAGHVTDALVDYEKGPSAAIRASSLRSTVA